MGRDDLEITMLSAGAVLATLDPFVRSDDLVGCCGASGWRLPLLPRSQGLRVAEKGKPSYAMPWLFVNLVMTRALRSAEWPARLPGFFDLSPEPISVLLHDLGARFVGRAHPLRFAA